MNGSTLFLNNWPRKLSALLISAFIWITINQQMMMTRRFVNVPIRITGLHPEKTIQGLSLNGMLQDQPVELVVTGRRFGLKNLSAADLEIAIDASGQTGLWQPVIRASNIYDASTKVSLKGVVTKVSAKPITLQVVPIVKKAVPIYVAPPRGESPIGYTFMNVWPQSCTLTIRGSQREVDFLQERGIPLQIDLSRIAKAELDALSSGSDIIRYELPDSWKKVHLPLPPYTELALTDKNATHIYINFLKNDLIPLGNELPIRLFFPSSASPLSPQSIKIRTSDIIKSKEGEHFLNLPIFIGGVSPLFASLVRDHLQIVLYFDGEKGQPLARWAPDVIASKKLRHRYVEHVALRDKLKITPMLREKLEQEFMSFITRMRLYTEPKQQLKIQASLEDKTLIIDTPHNRKTDND